MKRIYEISEPASAHLVEVALEVINPPPGSSQATLFRLVVKSADHERGDMIFARRHMRDARVDAGYGIFDEGLGHFLASQLAGSSNFHEREYGQQ